MQNHETSANCRRRSSTGISASDRRRIRQEIGPVVQHSRSCLHSPEKKRRSTAKPTALLHASRYINARVRPGCRASLLGALSDFRASSGVARPRLVARGFGRVVLKIAGRGFLGWFGPALVVAGPLEWAMPDVLGPCRVVINYTDELNNPRCFVDVHNEPWTAPPGGGRAVRGRITSVCTEPLVTCFRRTQPPTDTDVVKHWSPFTRLIYAKCDDVASADTAIARVNSANAYSCVYCGKTFGSSIKGLLEHLRLSERATFVTNVPRTSA